LLAEKATPLTKNLVADRVAGAVARKGEDGEKLRDCSRSLQTLPLANVLESWNGCID
jgi:hypothetical protein